MVCQVEIVQGHKELEQEQEEEETVVYFVKIPIDQSTDVEMDVDPVMDIAIDIIKTI